LSAAWLTLRATIGQNSTMNLMRSSIGVAVAALFVTACAGGTGAAWTYAPLGPTPAAVASTAASPGQSAAASPGGSPAGSPAASAGTSITVETPADNPLGYVPNPINAPANTEITVTYTNNSPLEHNINFFNGQDQNAESLAATERVTGPNAPETVTFTTPATPGDYFFWCDVHLQGMTGTLHVE
jgi:plastocyanin